MLNDITLKAEGYMVTFKFKRFPTYNTSLDLIVIFSLDPKLGEVEASSIPMPIRLKDLYELTTYLEQHIQNLQKDPFSSASYAFVPVDLQFAMQAFAGEVRALDDGEFTVQFMVNVGRQTDGGTSVYVGGETMVTLENINHFIAALRSLIAETSSS